MPTDSWLKDLSSWIVKGMTPLYAADELLSLALRKLYPKPKVRLVDKLTDYLGREAKEAEGLYSPGLGVRILKEPEVYTLPYIYEHELAHHDTFIKEPLKATIRAYFDREGLEKDIHDLAVKRLYQKYYDWLKQTKVKPSGKAKSVFAVGMKKQIESGAYE